MKKQLSESNLPFCLDDLARINSISSPCLSPDSSQIACVITQPDMDQNSSHDYVTLVARENKHQRTLVAGTSPRWSPSGSEIAYESPEGALWIYQVENDEKRWLTQRYDSAYFMGHLAEKNFLWSPDGTHIAYLSTCPFSASAEPEARVINRLLYKTKGGRGRPLFTDDRLTHIWLIPTSGGEPEVITPGDYNEHSISWSPDSRQIAFISNRSADPDNNQYSDLWKVDVVTQEVVRLTDDRGSAFQPAWSPDGKFIAYLATTRIISTNDSPADDTHLYLLPARGGSPRCLTKALDRRIENISWHPNGEYIYFTAGSEGTTSLYRISIASKAIETVITGKFQLLEYSLSTTGEDMVSVRTTTHHPAELYLTRENSPDTVQLTHQHGALVSTRRLQEADTFWFKSFDETPVQGWIMKPAFFSATTSYPLILVIHGGPHNMFGYAFEERMQLLAAQGYGVLFINPRGSSGYGQAFSNGCVLNWGGGDYQDLMAGLDDAIARHPWIDPDHLGVTGQSYGGYMTNWIITQTPRFKAAVVDGGISNLISFSGTSLYHSLIEAEFHGKASDHYPLLWQWSPLRNVSNVTTPTLFLHGETDNEVPVSQAEEMYVALKKCGVKTTLVQYVGEGHGWRPELAPSHKYDLYQRMIQWFNQHTTKA